MDAWSTYRLADFVPVTPQVYWRLLERINESFWPLHILTVALGVAALTLALRGNARTTLCLVVPAWLSSGIIFHLVYYAELNWAAPWFGWTFVAQAAMLLAIAAFGRATPSKRPAERTAKLAGASIATGALLFYPLIAVTLGEGLAHSEVFGLHPDPTAIATLGIVLITLRGAVAWLSILLPFAWCLTATLTLIPLGAAWAWLPASVAVFAIILLIAAATRGGRVDDGMSAGG